MEIATLAGGCFWGLEPVFRKLDGVTNTQVGYTGGITENPTYKQVCTGQTGHAEAVEITFDPKKINFEKILDLFWANHNPTSLNFQGPDHGTQYRSAIFYHSEQQKELAQRSKDKLEKSGQFKQPIVTEITPAGPFYRAEEYHQQYLEKTGQASCHI